MDYAVTAINSQEFLFDQEIVLTLNKNISQSQSAKMKISVEGKIVEINSSSILSGKISFKMPKIVAGTYSYVVVASINGNATFQIPNTITSPLKVTSITPSSAFRGGELVTITGNGFSPSH